MAGQSTSKVAWKYGLKGARSVRHRAPVLLGDTVLCAFSHGQGSVFRGTLAALDIESGDEIWRFDADHSLCEPLITEDGHILVSCFDGSVHKLTSDGDIVWRARPGERNIWSGIVLQGHYVYAEIAGGARFTRGLSLQDGSVSWEFENGGHAYSLGSDGDYRVVHSSVSGGLGKSECRLLCLDSRDGSLIWKYEHDEYLFRPLIVGDSVFVGSQPDAYVFDLRTGELRARQHLGEYAGITAPPIETGDGVILVAEDGQIWRMRAGTSRSRLFGGRRVRLEQEWRCDLQEKLKAGVLLRGNELLAISEAGELIRIDTQSGVIAGQQKLPYFKEGFGMVAAGSDLIVAVSKDVYKLQNLG